MPSNSVLQRSMYEKVHERGRSTLGLNWSRRSSKASKTDWKRVRATKDKDVIVSSGHPEAEMKHIVRGIASVP